MYWKLYVLYWFILIHLEHMTLKNKLVSAWSNVLHDICIYYRNMRVCLNILNDYCLYYSNMCVGFRSYTFVHVDILADCIEVFKKKFCSLHSCICMKFMFWRSQWKYDSFKLNKYIQFHNTNMWRYFVYPILELLCTPSNWQHILD